MRYLRALVLAKYQRFRWQFFFDTHTANVEKGGKDCKTFRDERAKQFIDEADEITTSESPEGGGGEEGEQTSTGDYTKEPPTGGYPKEPPKGGGGGYEQKPPAGIYPERPPTRPPTDEYKDTPVQQQDTYQGRQKK
jgi:hypothetical protein